VQEIRLLLYKQAIAVKIKKALNQKIKNWGTEKRSPYYLLTTETNSSSLFQKSSSFFDSHFSVSPLQKQKLLLLSTKIFKNTINCTIIKKMDF